MRGKTRKILSISALAAIVFLWDYGVYMFFDAYVAKLFLVVILLSGAWSYYELRRAGEIPPEEDKESTDKKQSQITNKTEQND